MLQFVMTKLVIDAVPGIYSFLGFFTDKGLVITICYYFYPIGQADTRNRSNPPSPSWSACQQWTMAERRPKTLLSKLEKDFTQERWVKWILKNAVGPQNLTFIDCNGK